MTQRYKYPRTYHCPWSENLKNDDRKHPAMDEFFNNEIVIVTEKMDGENTTMYNDFIHARSIDSANANHPTRDMVKSIWGNIKYTFDEDFRLCGENMYALHSIQYNDLDSYFYVFSSWYENSMHDWEETLKVIVSIKEDTGIELATPPMLYYGIYDKEKIHESWLNHKKNLNRDSEGYVIRVCGTQLHDFNDTFFYNIAKFVRKNHVQTDEHWLEHWTPKDINFLRGKK